MFIGVGVSALGRWRVVNTVPLKSTSAVTVVNVITTLFMSLGYSQSGIGQGEAGKKRLSEKMGELQRLTSEHFLRVLLFYIHSLVKHFQLNGKC